ncbi:TetR/AcrR family transcriptional regulator [Hyphobacterium sp. CCMP332]|uniref:TetR/AcrR family transcriptional regulator n=1 Tax=Hyphobacterium sp. CCMP332 TaxID=2749086 RepID=UPI00164EF6C6|nr:TetR/AcrR family transcriptional regulator [Hyphobacterium sp. CCMP332]QNL19948.1 TetR/AcrR family transcriptional regulator [Hyphobacterium sp. CCMP332]
MSTYHHGNLQAALLERAIEVIGHEGVEGLSLRKVAKDLGVSHAAPKRHFRNKADLLAAIVREAYQELTKTVLADVEGVDANDALRRLNLMARSTIRWAVENKAKFSVMTNPDVSRFADDELKVALADFTKLLSHALNDAKSQGFRESASMQTLLVYSVGAALGVATILTDELMRSVLGATENERAIAAMADQIVPIESSR